MPKKYSPELRERAVRLVLERQAVKGGPRSRSIRAIAPQVGVGEETLRLWCNRYGPEAEPRPVAESLEEQNKRLKRELAEARRASARALRDEVLLPEIKRIHQENYSVYGVRKMHHAMLRSGWQIGRDQVARLMRIAGLQGVRRGRKPRTTRPAGHPDTRLDLVERRFTAERPNQLWVADITYVRVLTGLCYVAFITDVCTRRIVGWAVSASLHTTGLPLLALEHALLSTGTSRGHEGLIHHSDKGSQYVTGILGGTHHRRGNSLRGHRGRLLRQRPGRNR